MVEVHEVFLDDALRLSGEQHEASFNDREREALRRLVSLSNPDWVAVKAMVLCKQCNGIMDELYEIGARGIIVTDIRSCRL